MPLPVYKISAWFLPFFPRSPRSSAPAITTVTHLRTTASTTTLKMVGDSGSPYVTPRAPWNAIL